MEGVDLSTYVFDYDLTFAILLMNPDGTVYHRYGTRDHTSGTSRMSMGSLVRLLRDTLEDHKAYQKAPKPPKAVAKRTVEQIPPMARKLEKRRREKKKRDAEEDCIHCHMVNEAERDYAREGRRWSRDATLSMWPLPEKVGLVLDREDQPLVKKVLPGSAAAAGGIKPRDRIVRMGDQLVRTQSDVQWVLERAPSDGASIPVELLREGASNTAAGKVEARIQPKKGWKAPTDLDFSWRASMWSLNPKPGFGGKRLGQDELAKLGLAPDTFALEVGYIVDWGDEAHTGRSARAAGIKRGDVVLSVAGKKDFASEMHFQTWFRFTQKPGTKADVEVLREGKKVKIELPVLP